MSGGYVQLPVEGEYDGGSPPMFDQSPLGIPQMPRSDRADLIDKIKPEQVIEKIRHRLLGETEKDGDWVKVPALANYALSEEGAWEISNLMLGTASTNMSMSKLQDFEIKRRLLNISITAQYMCICNWERYHIKNSAQFYFVHDIVFTNGLAVLKQADNASIQELLKGTVTENRNVNTEVRPPGRLKRLLGMG